jgi:NADH-quinone oxidoreductase subunit C
MDSALDDLRETIALRHPDAVVEYTILRGELTVTIASAAIMEFVGHLRTDPTCRFTTLIDITAVDWPAREKRFDMVYHFLSMHLNQRIRVRAEVREDEIVPSITAEFPSADWYEREVFDMYGILFAGHPDLRRILTDYGFRGFPLRKDFPTTGYVELRYDEEQRRVVYEPVKLNRRRTRSPARQPVDDLIGAKRLVAAEEFVEHLAPDRRQALPAFQADGFRDRHRVVAAALVVVIRRGENRPKQALLACWFRFRHASI